jgi:hypothetical protein
MTVEHFLTSRRNKSNKRYPILGDHFNGNGDIEEVFKSTSIVTSYRLLSYIARCEHLIEAGVSLPRDFERV